MCRVVVPDGFARLGDICVEAGVVLDEELKDALSNETLLGEALEKANVIDEKTLQRALVLQLLKRLERFFGFPTATQWSFGSEVTAFEGMPAGVRIDTLRVLWAGLTAHGEMGQWLAASVKRIGESPFKVRLDVNLRRFGFTGDARKLVKVVRDERVSIAELIALGIAPEEVVKNIVYLLAVTRYLDFSPVGRVDSAPPHEEALKHDSLDEMPSISEEQTVDGEPPSSRSTGQLRSPRPTEAAACRQDPVATRGGAAFARRARSARQRRASRAGQCGERARDIQRGPERRAEQR